MDRKKVFWIKTAVYAILALIGLLIGFLHANALGIGYHDEFIDTVRITGEEDLRKMGSSFYNNICYLENDITVSSVSALAGRGHPFVGVFDGQGHTVTLKGPATVASFFGYIAEGGVVRNLTVVVEESHISSRNLCAVLAIENAGTIENCRVVVKECYVEARGSYAAVSINRGSMRFVSSEIHYIGAMSEHEQASSAALLLATHAARNFGRVESAVSTVTYRNIAEVDGDRVADGSVANRGAGAVVGNNQESGVLQKCSALIEAGVHLSDVHGTALTQTSLNKSDIYSIENIFYILGFREDIWELRGGELVMLQGV